MTCPIDGVKLIFGLQSKISTELYFCQGVKSEKALSIGKIMIQILTLLRECTCRIRGHQFRSLMSKGFTSSHSNTNYSAHIYQNVTRPAIPSRPFMGILDILSLNQQLSNRTRPHIAPLVPSQQPINRGSP